MINSLVMLEQIYLCACSLNPSSSFTRRSPSTAHTHARHSPLITCHFPLTPLFPLHTTIPPVSPLFPLHTKNRGWARPARDGFSRSPTSTLLVSHETRAVSHVLLCVQHVQRTFLRIPRVLKRCAPYNKTRGRGGAYPGAPACPLLTNELTN